MNKQRLSNLFKLKIYDVEDVIQYCIENDIDIITNDFEDTHTQYGIKDIHMVWKTLLRLKPYNKYSK